MAGAKERWLLFQDLQIVMEKIDPVATRAFELASEYQLSSAYDAAYLAIAERLGAVLVTADERLLNAVQSKLKWVKTLRDFEP
jgi:predicted nucleic acid-binding protein